MTAQPMRVAFAPRQVRSTRRKLLWSCAAAAIVVTAGTTAQKARAQAFQGTPTLPNPNIAVRRGGDADDHLADHRDDHGRQPDSDDQLDPERQ